MIIQIDLSISGICYQFRQQNNPGDVDAFQMLQLLLEWKDLEPLWIVKPRLDLISFLFCECHLYKESYIVDTIML